jgi:hypothetical protein
MTPGSARLGLAPCAAPRSVERPTSAFGGGLFLLSYLEDCGGLVELVGDDREFAIDMTEVGGGRPHIVGQFGIAPTDVERLALFPGFRFAFHPRRRNVEH